MENKLFCEFITETMGYCGTYTGGGNCPNHLGVVGVRKEKAKKFRGDSKFQKENLGFKNK